MADRFLVERVNAALVAAEQGDRPSFSPEALVGELGLNGDTPDGLTLWDRFVGEKPTIGSLRGVVTLMRGARRLIEATNAYTANGAQTELAETLSHVVARQVLRETVICPDAAGLAALSTRSDIMEPRVRAAAIEASGGQSAQELIDAALPEALVEETLAQLNTLDQTLKIEDL